MKTNRLTQTTMHLEIKIPVFYPISVRADHQNNLLPIEHHRVRPTPSQNSENGRAEQWTTPFASEAT